MLIDVRLSFIIEFEGDFLNVINELRKIGFEIGLNENGNIFVRGNSARTNHTDNLLNFLRRNKDEAVKFLRSEQSADKTYTGYAKNCFRLAFDFFMKHKDASNINDVQAMNADVDAMANTPLLMYLVSAAIKEIQRRYKESSGQGTAVQTALDEIGYEITDDEAERLGDPWNSSKA